MSYPWETCRWHSWWQWPGNSALPPLPLLHHVHTPHAARLLDPLLGWWAILGRHAGGILGDDGQGPALFLLSPSFNQIHTPHATGLVDCFLGCLAILGSQVSGIPRDGSQWPAPLPPLPLLHSRPHSSRHQVNNSLVARWMKTAKPVEECIWCAHELGKWKTEGGTVLLHLLRVNVKTIGGFNCITVGGFLHSLIRAIKV